MTGGGGGGGVTRSGVVGDTPGTLVVVACMLLSCHRELVGSRLVNTLLKAVDGAGESRTLGDVDEGLELVLIETPTDPPVTLVTVTAPDDVAGMSVVRAPAVPETTTGARKH